ncbi:MAG: hypothetical protein LUI06_07290 [Ruminococcus sp.]|nr:hypothetical protein [Ruminococcus sp.]
MLKLRRILAFICYIAMLAADALSAYVIYESITGGFTYYFGMLLFTPIFIFTYWMQTFFSQLTFGKEKGKRIMPRALRKLLSWLGNIISLVLLGFWIYIYYMQLKNETVNETLMAMTINLKW